MPTATPSLPDPRDRPLLKVSDVVELLRPTSRAAIYRRIASGDLPSVRWGRSLFIPTARLRVLFGLPAEPASEPSSAAS